VDFLRNLLRQVGDVDLRHCPISAIAWLHSTRGSSKPPLSGRPAAQS
jgi:hypothetical protein